MCSEDTFYVTTCNAEAIDTLHSNLHEAISDCVKAKRHTYRGFECQSREKEQTRDYVWGTVPDLSLASKGCSLVARSTNKRTIEQSTCIKIIWFAFQRTVEVIREKGGIMSHV